MLLVIAYTEPRAEVGVADSRPHIGAELTLELVQQTEEPPTTPRTDGAALMTGTPRTPRGFIPYETDLLREQLEEQLAMTTALREQLEASSAEAAVKQLREHWLLAEDRADQRDQHTAHQQVVGQGQSADYVVDHQRNAQHCRGIL